MVNWLVRGILLLWAVFFGLVGARELVSATPYFDMFGVTGSATAINSVRADLSAFFLVAAGGAAIGALIPSASRALLVPAALFGCALLGRAIGLGVGDALNAAITQAMIAEALSVALMLGAMWQLSRPTPEAVAADAAVPQDNAGSK